MKVNQYSSNKALKIRVYQILKQLKANGLNTLLFEQLLQQGKIKFAEEGTQSALGIRLFDKKAATVFPGYSWIPNQNFMVYSPGYLVVLRRNTIAELLSGRFSEWSSSAITIIHELLHILIHSTGCFLRSPQEEEFLVDAIIRLIQLKSMVSQNHNHELKIRLKRDLNAVKQRFGSLFCLKVLGFQ